MAKKYASEMVKLMQSWLGKKESDGSFKEIVDIYNSIKHERGPMSYDYAWCAATVSAAAIKLGYTDICPVEMSCSRLITMAKNMGIWIEDESITPTPGMWLLYDWDEKNKKGDNKGDPEHIGLVEKVNGKEIYIIEGNYCNAVKRRIVEVDGIYFRGYIAPKYDAEPTVKIFPVKRSTSKTGFHRCTGNLNLRTGPSTKYKMLELMPKDSIVTAMGEYASNGKTDWLLVAAESGLTGWCSSKYLEKI